jgi:hypothetical protein
MSAAWICDSRGDGAGVAREVAPDPGDGVTPNYLLHWQRRDDGERELVANPRGDAAAVPRLLDTDGGTYTALVPIPGADSTLLVAGIDGTVSVSRYDIPQGTARRLARFSLARGEHFDVAADARHAYIALGRDLAILEHASGRMIHYVQDFLPGGFTGEPGGVDMNGISRLLLDRHRLIAIANSGNAGISLDLRQLEPRSDAATHSPR